MSGLTRRLATWRFLIAAVLWLSYCAPIEAEIPLFEEDPFDQITLDAANHHAVLKVKPLDLPDEQIPAKLKSRDKLVIRLFDEPDADYEVSWRSITKVERFNQLILDRANALAAGGRLDEAYDYFRYLEQDQPNTPGLGKAVEDYLYEEASQSQRLQRYDEALAILKELYRRNPRRPGLEQAMGAATDDLLRRYADAEDYHSLRTLLGSLATAYPEHPVVKRWSSRWKAKASALFAHAQAEADAGRLPEAAELGRQVASVWPRLPGARELVESIHRRYPRLVVGVAASAMDLTPSRLDDWAAQRTSRLVYRTLTEFTGPGGAGGNYICTVGNIGTQALGRRLIIQLRPDIRWAQGDRYLTGLDVSDRLLAMANPDNAAYRPDWANLLAAVSVRETYTVEAELRRAHLRPEAMLQTILTPATEASRSEEPPPANGPFQATSRTDREAVFRANHQYFAAEPGQLQEIVERRYASFAEAFVGIRRGDIQVLDRLSPWNLAVVRAQTDLTVEAYAIPRIHCLIPNPRRPLTADRTFRRALVYGIHRQVILDQMLDGLKTPGCRVISGPFPEGIDANDPIGYAVDPSIQPRPYDPRLAIALANVALKNSGAARNEQGKPLKTMPRLVLAYPHDEVARGACAAIQRHLALLGIPTELRPLERPLPRRIPDDVDLLYMELALFEPLVDARRLLGDEGPAGGCSPYMILALRQLDEAQDWSQVRDRLGKVHRLVYEETSVLPLWQLTEHFAYRKGLNGITENPVSLYQNIERWRPTFQYSTTP